MRAFLAAGLPSVATPSLDWKELSLPSGKCGVCKAAVFCRKVPVLLEKKINKIGFSDQKIEVMVRGYLPR